MYRLKASVQSAVSEEQLTVNKVAFRGSAHTITSTIYYLAIIQIINKLTHILN